MQIILIRNLIFKSLKNDLLCDIDIDSILYAERAINIIDVIRNNTEFTIGYTKIIETYLYKAFYHVSTTEFYHDIE